VAVALKRNNKKLSSFRCNDGYTEYVLSGPATRSNPFAELKDTFSTHHVITCFALTDGGAEQPIDFLFDDLSTPFASTSRGGIAGSDCIAGGGDYDGKNCWLDKNLCAALDRELKAMDSNSRGAEWRDEIGACLLLDSKYVRDRDRAVALSINIGKASISCIGAIAAAPFTGASSVPGCAATVIMVVGMAAEESAKAAMEEWSSEIIRESRACLDGAPAAASACAERAIAGHLLRASYARSDNNIRSRAIPIVDDSVRQLIDLLSEDTQARIFANENEDAWIAAVKYFDGKLSATDKRTLFIKNAGVYIQEVTTIVLTIDTALNLTGAKAAFSDAKKWLTIYKNKYSATYNTLAQFKAAFGNDISPLVDWASPIRGAGTNEAANRAIPR